MKETFIKTYDVFEPEFCDSVIRSFEDSMKVGAVHRRNNKVRVDNQYEMNKPEDYRDPESKVPQSHYDSLDLRNSPLCSHFFQEINEAIKTYMVELGLDGIIDNTYMKNMLIQRYVAEDFESYSQWHVEAGNMSTADRALVYMVYLNDDFEGGETEFKYQLHKEKPKLGKIVIWPPGFTHVHRGAMLTKGTKYIATGWAFWAPMGVE